MVQNLSPYTGVKTLETVSWESSTPAARDQPAQTEAHSNSAQTLAMGPVASQLAIKMLGTHGGGFFNANSAHLFDNPPPLSNFVQMLSIFKISAALCIVFDCWWVMPGRAWLCWPP